MNEIMDETVATGSPSQEASEASTSRGAGRRWALPGVAGALVVGAGVLALVNHGHSSAADASEEARKVGTAHVEELLAYRHGTLEEELAEEREWLTDDFAATYSDLVTSKVAPAATKAKVSTNATVVGAGAQEASADEVTLLVFVNVVTNSKELSQPRITGGRLEVVMERVDGNWLIGSLDPV